MEITPSQRSRLLKAASASNFTKSQRLILMHLIRAGHETISFGIGTIAKKLDLSHDTVKVAFRRFEAVGFLRLTHKERLGKFPRVYDFRLLSCASEPEFPFPAEFRTFDVFLRNPPPVSARITTVSVGGSTLEPVTAASQGEALLHHAEWIADYAVHERTHWQHIPADLHQMAGGVQ